MQRSFFHLVISILPVRTAACFVLRLMAFVLFRIASAFFRLFGHMWFPPSIQIELDRSSLGCPDFFIVCLVRFYAYVKAH